MDEDIFKQARSGYRLPGISKKLGGFFLSMGAMFVVALAPAAGACAPSDIDETMSLFMPSQQEATTGIAKAPEPREFQEARDLQKPLELQEPQELQKPAKVRTAIRTRRAVKVRRAHHAHLSTKLLRSPHSRRDVPASELGGCVVTGKSVEGSKPCPETRGKQNDPLGTQNSPMNDDRDALMLQPKGDQY